ncbi:DNA topoisomerase 2-binding protein 1-A isoform X2 [Tripterygium wilfordii]|uniref:DNA topoisomerase 2-binding protein 1-A isoform X2 n=1 Tax=Tripterygium wilfordii TaxID=458696 RepID=UPI0018F853DD|nr:DNA topoisomerase 2-binding protein 1-A isoform X2 [Tripterygium wilfordii]
MLKTKTFKGANVFMSRKLVPPEIFDALLDALKHNGAEVFLCCDPSRNGPEDYHVIASPDHEKFEDLRAKGCNVLGPQCVLSCAKEHRALPKQGFRCCLAMDGLKVLVSGFEMDEKVKIEKMVTAMGGVLHTKASSDASFVIVKNVLAAKYKWALNILQKPVVTLNWLYQCWNEHRVVPQESYRVLPFSGLTICITRIPADERKEIEKLIVQNGGKYSAELTKKCTHLISDAPEGDKYLVARRWGHIHIITRKWFDQSMTRRACLNEESYPVQGGSKSSKKTVSGCLMAQQSQGNDFGNQSAHSSVPAESNMHTDPDLETTLSQNMSSMFADDPISIRMGDSEVPTVETTNEVNFDGCVANDSQSEDNDMYLSDCRIVLTGFEASEMRKLVNLVRKGGGSRYMSFDERLTHIVVGTPSEAEKKEARGLAALGMINVVRSNWLEDCDREKKEVPVLRRHVAYDLLLPKESMKSTRGAVMGMTGTNQSKSSTVHSNIVSDQLLASTNSGTVVSSALEKIMDQTLGAEMDRGGSLEATLRFSKKSLLPSVNDHINDHKRTLHDSTAPVVQNRKSSNVFKQKFFRFSNSFPEDRRAEIVQWVNQGGGKLVDDHIIHTVHYTIERHGVIAKSADAYQTTYVSSHWIRSCLEDGSLLAIGSHILFSPLPCRIPFPGFQSFRFCVSQYEEKDRVLLRNFCFVLGAKFAEKLTKKATHLLCKFANGPKYEAACKWGIHVVTSEWLYECVRQNEVVALDSFCPKEVTAEDREAGFCTVSQFPTQAARTLSGESPSQFVSQLHEPIITPGIGVNSSREMTKQSSVNCKRARISEDDNEKSRFLGEEHATDSICNLNSNGDDISKDIGEPCNLVPDVAAAIEDLLEQTSKIQDQKSPERTGGSRSVFFHLIVQSLVETIEILTLSLGCPSTG